MARIFVVDQEYQADVKCLKVHQEGSADLLVYVVDQEYQATSDEKWFFVQQEYSASTRIFWVEQEYQAVLRVFFVSEEYQAKWNHGHALQNRL